MVDVKHFLAYVEEIAAEEPGYQHGHSGDDHLCDCIGLIIGAIRRAGGQWHGTHGSNYAARYEVRQLLPITKAADLTPGDAVFKSLNPGEQGYDLPAKYKGDLRDYYHVGVVVSVTPLRIRHMTTPKPKMDTKLGNWKWYGKLKKIDYGEEHTPVEEKEPVSEQTNYKAKVVGNGALNMRREPSKESVRVMQIPVGSVVTVTAETNDEWRQISYGGHTGYVMAQYLEKDTNLGVFVQVDRTVLEAIYDEIGDLLGLRG